MQQLDADVEWLLLRPLRGLFLARCHRSGSRARSNGSRLPQAGLAVELVERGEDADGAEGAVVAAPGGRRRRRPSGPAGRLAVRPKGAAPRRAHGPPGEPRPRRAPDGQRQRLPAAAAAARRRPTAGEWRCVYRSGELVEAQRTCVRTLAKRTLSSLDPRRGAAPSGGVSRSRELLPTPWLWTEPHFAGTLPEGLRRTVRRSVGSLRKVRSFRGSPCGRLGPVNCGKGCFVVITRSA